MQFGGPRRMARSLPFYSHNLTSPNQVHPHRLTLHMQFDGPARIARAVLSRARVDARVLDVERRELERTRFAHAVIVATARNQVAVLAPEDLRWEKAK